MRILYLSCHSVLEYDELKLFSEMGHEIFSMGAYSNPNSNDLPRPALPNIKYHTQLHSTYMQCSKENIHEELVNWADVIVMMHNSRVDVVDHPQPWLGSTRVNSKGATGDNWSKMKHKPVIWRSIGQSVASIEESLAPFRKDGLKIVRYSPRERHIPGYVGEDAVIRFYKDPEEFTNWSGEVRKVITFAQRMAHPTRRKYLHFDIFMQATDGFQRTLFGRDNSDAMNVWGGEVTYESMKEELRRNAVYFYTGTSPASYTLSFIEAMMTGIPIVSVGPKIANAEFPGHETFEISDIIKNGVNGFWSDNIAELRDDIDRLLNDANLSRQISEEGRKTAIELFGKENIRRQWADFLNRL